MQNHAEYARQHGMQSTWSSALVDAAYDGAWNKMAFLQKVLRSELTKSETDWLLWVDWDAIFTDMAFELPLEEYEQRRLRLVIGGDPSAIGGGPQQRADYLKANWKAVSSSWLSLRTRPMMPGMEIARAIVEWLRTSIDSLDIS